MMFKTLLILVLILSGCSAIGQSEILPAKETIVMDNNKTIAKVMEVQATGKANSYTFAVTVNSSDTGCDRYADWWEVVTPEGELIYRRVLLHSHVDEQPFRRTGGSVAIEPQQEVIVRVHMSTDGYSPLAQKGAVKSGFAATTLSEDFATNLESVEPLPKGCAF